MAVSLQVLCHSLMQSVVLQPSCCKRSC